MGEQRIYKLKITTQRKKCPSVTFPPQIQCGLICVKPCGQKLVTNHGHGVSYVVDHLHGNRSLVLQQTTGHNSGLFSLKVLPTFPLRFTSMLLANCLPTDTSTKILYEFLILPSKTRVQYRKSHTFMYINKCSVNLNTQGSKVHYNRNSDGNQIISTTMGNDWQQTCMWCQAVKFCNRSCHTHTVWHLNQQ